MFLCFTSLSSLVCSWWACSIKAQKIVTHNPLAADCKYKIQHTFIIHSIFLNRTTQASDSASVWFIVHEVLSWSPPESDFFLHFMSLTTPHPPSFLVLYAVDFIVAEPLGWLTYAHIYSYKISSTDRWNAVRLSSVSVFTASLHAKGICEG